MHRYDLKIQPVTESLFLLHFNNRFSTGLFCLVVLKLGGLMAHIDVVDFVTHNNKLTGP